MKFYVRLFVLVATIVIVITAGIYSGLFKFSVVSNTSSSEQKLILKSIEEIGNLELLKYRFNDIVEERITRKLFDIDNLAPDSKVLIVVNGEAVACINLKTVKPNDIQVYKDSIVILLPEPIICYSKVDHQNSKIYSMNLTARILNPEMADEAYRNAEGIIHDEAIRNGIITQAKLSAKKILNPLLKQISDKLIVLKFVQS